MTPCPCGSHKDYVDCCGLFIANEKIPATPEELMRSRYTAYTKANIDYIINTMKAPANHDFNADEAYAWAKRVKWEKLSVLNSSVTSDKGFVEFIAYFCDQDTSYSMHELSEFRYIDGHWYYVDGKQL